MLSQATFNRLILKHSDTKLDKRTYPIKFRGGARLLRGGGGGGGALLFY